MSKKHTVKNIITAVVMLGGLAAPVRAAAVVDRPPLHGAASTNWSDNWQWGLVTGNGTMGALIYGQPGREQIVATEARLWLPLGSREIVPDIGQFLPELRQIIGEKGYNAGEAFYEQKAREQGWQGLVWTDPFHMAFDLKMHCAAGPEVTNYLRTENFATGEVTTSWQDSAGEWEHRLFVSRADNVIVFSLCGPKGGLACDLVVDKTSPELIHPDVQIGREWITGHMTYAKGKGGFDYAIRVTSRGGRQESDGSKISLTGADEVLVVARIHPWKTPLPGSDAWAYSPQNPDFAHGVKTNWVADLQHDLGKLSERYDKLLAPHAKLHGALFNRVTLDLGGGADRRLTTDELLARAARDNSLPPALLEKMYDAGRYMFICAAGESLPNLQGIWTGDWSPIWSSDYTTDANVECAIASGLSANLPELMNGYFRTVESWVPDMQLNARRIYGCRGVFSNPRASNNDLMLHWGNGWDGEMWTAGAGWMAYWFYDYYLYTGDKKFLATRCIPLLKQVALFYEDFLKGSVDENGKYRFRPSFSPECQLGDDATMDIAVAKEALNNLIAACGEIPGAATPDEMSKWHAMLEKMPPYRINEKGELAEMASPGHGENYGHRHHSLLYPVFQSHEFTPDGTPDLWAASKKMLLAKVYSGGEKSTFGRIQSGLAAAYLHMPAVVYDRLRCLAAGGSMFTSLITSHEPNHDIFNVDGNGGIPEIVDEMLVCSKLGRLELLPALPVEFPRGEICGILARGQIHILRLAWDTASNQIQLDLESGMNQNLRVSTERGIINAIADGRNIPLEKDGTFVLPLRKGHQVSVTIRLTPKH